MVSQMPHCQKSSKGGRLVLLDPGPVRGIRLHLWQNGTPCVRCDYTGYGSRLLLPFCTPRPQCQKQTVPVRQLCIYGSMQEAYSLASNGDHL